jgi:hypothetical protein
MHDENRTRPFAGELVPYYYAPPNDMESVVRRVRELLEARG